MGKQDIVDPVKISQLPLIRKRFPEDPQFLANCPWRNLGITCLPLIPQIADIVIAIAPLSLRIFFRKIDCRIIGLNIQIQIELLPPIVRNMRPACPGYSALLH